jgi:hypothetical protein
MLPQEDAVRSRLVSGCDVLSMQRVFEKWRCSVSGRPIRIRNLLSSAKMSLERCREGSSLAAASCSCRGTRTLRPR